MTIELIIAALSAFVAAIALILQSYYNQRSAKLSALSMLSEVLKRRIEEKEQIIQILKDKGNDWSAQASVVNKHLKPASIRVNTRIIRMLKSHLEPEDSELLLNIYNTKKDS